MTLPRFTAVSSASLAGLRFAQTASSSSREDGAHATHAGHGLRLRGRRRTCCRRGVPPSFAGCPAAASPPAASAATAAGVIGRIAGALHPVLLHFRSQQRTGRNARRRRIPAASLSASTHSSAPSGSSLPRRGVAHVVMVRQGGDAEIEGLAPQQPHVERGVAGQHAAFAGEEFLVGFAARPEILEVETLVPAGEQCNVLHLHQAVERQGGRLAAARLVGDRFAVLGGGVVEVHPGHVRGGEGATAIDIVDLARGLLHFPPGPRRLGRVEAGLAEGLPCCNTGPARRGPAAAPADGRGCPRRRRR